MGRTNTTGLVKYWLQHEGRKSLQICKFYTAEDLLLIFKTFPTVNNCPNPYTNINFTKGYVRSFATILNQIATNKWLPTFKHRYTKVTGFQYILVSEVEANKNVENIRISARKVISIAHHPTSSTLSSTSLHQLGHQVKLQVIHQVRIQVIHQLDHQEIHQMKHQESHQLKPQFDIKPQINIKLIHQMSSPS